MNKDENQIGWEKDEQALTLQLKGRKMSCIGGCYWKNAILEADWVYYGNSLSIYTMVCLEILNFINIKFVIYYIILDGTITFTFHFLLFWYLNTFLQRKDFKLSVLNVSYLLNME